MYVKSYPTHLRVVFRSSEWYDITFGVREQIGMLAKVCRDQKTRVVVLCKRANWEKVKVLIPALANQQHPAVIHNQ